MIVRGKISIPKTGLKLAEFIGTVLGDGCLTKDQCFIYFNMKKDREYADYVEKLIQKLFKYNPYKHNQEKQGVTVLLSSGRNLIDFLVAKGLKFSVHAQPTDLTFYQWLGIFKFYQGIKTTTKCNGRYN